MSPCERSIRIGVDWDEVAWIDALSDCGQLAWVKLLAHARRSGISGSVKELAPFVAARKFGLKSTNAAKDFSVMIDSAKTSGALLSEDGRWTITDWAKYVDRPNEARRDALERAAGGRIPASIRRRILSVGKCEYCGSPNRLTVDHKIPLARGGSHDESNLQCLCKSCNCRKKDRVYG